MAIRYQCKKALREYSAKSFFAPLPFLKFIDIIRTFAYSKYTHRAFAALAASFASQNPQKV
jgi:hypothetical protein